MLNCRFEVTEITFLGCVVFQLQIRGLYIYIYVRCIKRVSIHTYIEFLLDYSSNKLGFILYFLYF